MLHFRDCQDMDGNVLADMEKSEKFRRRLILIGRRIGFVKILLLFVDMRIGVRPAELFVS